jgi:hypothetical protein
MKIPKPPHTAATICSGSKMGTVIPTVAKITDDDIKVVSTPSVILIIDFR